MTRVSTGFHRIGLVLAVPLLVGACGLTAWEFRPVPDCNGMFDDLIPSSSLCRPVLPLGSAPNQHGSLSEPVPRFAGTPLDHNPYAVATSQPPANLRLVPVDHDPFVRPRDFRLAAFIAVIAVAAYAACRAVGWIIDGFTVR